MVLVIIIWAIDSAFFIQGKLPVFRQSETPFQPDWVLGVARVNKQLQIY
jgi:hypothetical protein